MTWKKLTKNRKEMLCDRYGSRVTMFQMVVFLGALSLGGKVAGA
jgi:hypothetical protein